jgi:hypothetical protein
MLRNPQVESFLASSERLASTRKAMEDSRNLIEQLPLLTELREAFNQTSRPVPSTIRAICERSATASVELILEEFCSGVGSNPFFVVPMQGHSADFAQRIILDSNPLFDVAIDVINCAQLARYKAESRKNLACRGISFYGKGMHTYVYKAGGLEISHWRHDAVMPNLAGTRCRRERTEVVADGQLIETGPKGTIMFESSTSNSVLVSIVLKRDEFPANLTFSALDYQLRFQNPSDQLDSRIQLSLSLLQEMNCEAAIPLMKGFLSHPRHYIRWHAMQCIMGIDALEVMEELSAMAAHDESEEVRSAARKTLTILEQETLRHAS